MPDSTSLSLVERLQAREPRAWERLVDLYGPTIYRWCRQSGVRPEDAQEVCQEVFCAVAQHVGRFRRERPGDSFRGWLRAIARNKLNDHFRRLGRQPGPQGGSAAQDRLMEIAESETESLLGGDDGQAETELRHRALELVRAEFEPRTFEAFWQVAVRRRAPAEAAKELGLSVAAVYQAKYRVLKRIRRELDEHGD